MSTDIPPQLSTAQLNAYLEHIGLPHLINLPSSAPRDLELLTTLHVHQITTIPYENLKLHYSDSDYSIDINPHVVLEKILEKRGRGGYCMEVSVLYKYFLEAMGFNVYWSGVRIRARDGAIPFGDYIGLVHVINIVKLTDKSQYVVDVAFGGDGPTLPMPLVEGLVHKNLGTQDIRYSRARILQSAPLPAPPKPEKSDTPNDPAKAPAKVQQKAPSKPYWLEDNLAPSELPPGDLDDPLTFWIYQYRNSEKLPWNSYYCFQLVPYMYNDFRIMSFAASAEGPKGSSPFQTTTVLVVKFIRAGNAKDGHIPEITGKKYLVNRVLKGFETKKFGAQKQTTSTYGTCTSEEERVGVLKKQFGIILTDAERDGIKGRTTEIKQPTNALERLQMQMALR